MEPAIEPALRGFVTCGSIGYSACWAELRSHFVLEELLVYLLDACPSVVRRRCTDISSSAHLLPQAISCIERCLRASVAAVLAVRSHAGLCKRHLSST